MRITLFINHNNLKYPKPGYYDSAKKSEPACDFVSFRKNTSAGNILKKFDCAPDAYGDVLLLNGKILDRACKRIDKAGTMQEIIKILSDYKMFFQPVEAKMFEYFERFSKNNPHLTLPDCLRGLYDDALARLKIEEFKVLDEVDRLSNDMSPKTALDVRYKTTYCRDIIIANREDERFKRKNLLLYLDQMNPLEDEKEAYEKMRDRALYLPTSSTSENAFIVKYADRSQNEIAKRLLRASVATVEHIKPDHLGGKNALSNFILVSAAMNSLRGHLSLAKFVERFSFIPACCQKYIEAIIADLNRGGILRGHEAYPYQVKRNLYKESNGFINLDLTSYKYSYRESFEAEREFAKRKKSKTKRVR